MGLGIDYDDAAVECRECGDVTYDEELCSCFADLKQTREEIPVCMAELVYGSETEAE